MLKPVVQRGGYIPICDHGIPNDVSWPNMIEYCKLLAKLTGWLWHVSVKFSGVVRKKKEYDMDSPPGCLKKRPKRYTRSLILKDRWLLIL